jgi:hypothetical protein
MGKIPAASTNASNFKRKTPSGKHLLAASRIGSRDDQNLHVFGGIAFHPVERFATPDRVFDDMWATFRISGGGYENYPFPIGTKVKMRVLHNFHILDGMIAKEIGNEIWRRDE